MYYCTTGTFLLILKNSERELASPWELEEFLFVLLGESVLDGGVGNGLEVVLCAVNNNGSCINIWELVQDVNLWFIFKYIWIIISSTYFK